MCGICGAVLGEAGSVLEATGAQLAAQRHRGRDAEGAYRGARAAIAQNRLSIIDLRTGDPPITEESDRIAAVLNGEIYNYRELRQRLSADGHRFSTATDTEVLAHLAETDAPEVLARRLDGMFAFAVWDERRERLVLGRDRFGKKPLYYYANAGQFVFASEIKGILAVPGLPCVLNEQAIPAYLRFGYVPTPHTFYEGIYSVPPGHVVTVQPGARPVVKPYWELPLRGGEQEDVKPPRSLAQAARGVRALLAEAVERRLIADVPIGAFLSGGVDSSAVVAMMAQHSSEPVPTFTIGFEDRDGYDERPYARLVARRFRTDHHEFVVKPDAVELAERLLWHHDQPFGDSSSIPTFMLSELTRSHVKVALCGDGGDELFAGYERFAAGLLVDRYAALPGPLCSAAGGLLKGLPGDLLRGRVRNLRRFSDVAALGMPHAYLSWCSFIDDQARRGLLGDEASAWADDLWREQWGQTAGAHILDRLLHLNVRTYLLDDLLVKVDRMSMAWGLEVRSPFLDRQLAEFAIALPPQWKVWGPFLKTVLKLAMRDVLPWEILVRRKRGFGVPLDRWFREELRSYAGGLLGSGARVRERVDQTALDRMLTAHMSGRENRGHALWALLMLELFLRNRDW
ncbi:MAG: asparagine synthase (glutamine-hydrolyzing) [Solirubrobacteraceae bacterium]